MASNLLEENLTEVLQTAVERSSGDLWIMDPTHRTVTAVIDVATDADGDIPTVRMLADEQALKTTFDDFLVASRTADLIETGTLSLRTLNETVANSLLIADNEVFAVVTAGQQVAALTTDDDEFVDTTRETCNTRWKAAEQFQLRTPPISEVRDTLGTEIGDGIRDDFDAVLASLDAARGDGDGLDEVTISLLVAARNEVLLYDISKWGEDVGIASKATFSRTKTKLEDTGLITTEKVPIDVGRPRLRLQLADDRLTEADLDEFADIAADIS
jgi:hypothetical protein